MTLGLQLDIQKYDCNLVLSPKIANSIQDDIPLIYVVTATYQRLVQRAELTRLSNAFRLVKRLHWIVVEPDGQISLNIQKLLNSSGINFTYFAQETNPSDQKNAGIGWIRTNHNPAVQAVLRYTKKLSAWPVAFSGRRKYETPIVENGKVVRFSAWNTHRKFPIDMAGFAINVKVLWKYHPRFTGMKDFHNGFEETHFLEQCCTVDDIEPRADNCTKILVWHTKTKKPTIDKIDHNVPKLEV
ncbi:Hypothetical predicted protein [Mytilus galloprovincialis]|uniref:Galactosylgalactosylxylosylprotein 3-beta-glucuronosyltransferase n=1 Tax=Mytilus galloprovincialis TaxID=29158 RepID=A0A8B6E445_MYTGA|nr:Hypothetical predicted protein [Mytilus galloprovincialis]